MPAIDYMKVLDIATFTLGTSSHIEFKALDLKLFSAVLTREDGSTFEILLRTSDYDLELSLNKTALNKKEFKKWLTKFEYELEQGFFKNIILKSSENKLEYKINIEF